MDELAAAVGAPLPPEFAVLSDEHRAALVAAVERAAQARSRLLDRGIEDSLRHLPGVLRRPVKRALGV
jgi:hypothetical protein